MRFQPKFNLLVVVLTLTTIVSSLYGQTVKELETQRKQTLQKLETTNKILNETKKSQRSSINKLTIISKNIKERKTLIKNIGTEIGQLDNQMQQLNREKTRLENELAKLKRDYAKLVQEAHVNRSMYTKIMFVLSAESFDQSLRRLRYLQEYSEYRKEQVHKIENVKTEIVHKNDSLKVNKDTKVEVVKQKETEAQKLSKDEKKEKVLLTDLQKKEKKLRADLKIQQKKAADLNNKIERIVAEVIRKAEAKKQAEKAQKADAERHRLEAENKRIAEENRLRKEKNQKIAEENKRIDAQNKLKSASKAVAKKETIPMLEPKKVETIAVNSGSSSNSAVSAQTKEETLLSGDFERNRGRLPWPTSNGFIRGHFGIQNHPVLKFVTINNKGIYIQTPAGSAARAVFDGVVSSIFFTPGSNSAVIIRHGKYLTIYANLTQISVQVGQKVSAKQSLGRIFTDGENDNKTELYFQVRNGTSIQNPENWLAN